MTTNLSELVNSMFKSIRSFGSNFFAIKGRQTHAMINFGSQYSEAKVAYETMNSDQQESTMHIVNE